MTLEELTNAYMDRAVDDEKISQSFTHMGKFGRITAWLFSFESETSTVRTEVCVKGGKIIGLTPEKEPLQDDWGYTPEEYEEGLTAEDLSRIQRYLNSVLADPT